MKTNVKFWKELIVYINFKLKERPFTRKELIEDMIKKGYVRKNYDGSILSTTLDTYRNYLTQAGYLKIKSRGVYVKMKNIPIKLSLSQVKKEAYKK